MCFTGYPAAACIFFLIIDILVFQKGKEKKTYFPLRGSWGSCLRELRFGIYLDNISHVKSP